MYNALRTVDCTVYFAGNYGFYLGLFPSKFRQTIGCGKKVVLFP